MALNDHSRADERIRISQAVDAARCYTEVFQASPRCQCSLHSAAYDGPIVNLLRFICMGFRYFASPSTRGNAGEPFGDHRRFADGVARQYDSVAFLFGNAGSFSERGSTHGRPF